MLDPSSDHAIQVSRGPVWCILGFATASLGSTVFPGGESEALKRLDRYLERKVILNYQLHVTLQNKVINHLFY